MTERRGILGRPYTRCIAGAALVIAWGVLFESTTAEAAENDFLSTLSEHDHTPLGTQLAEVRSPFVNTKSFGVLSGSVSQSLSAVDKLLATLPHVSDTQSVEVAALRAHRGTLAAMHGSLTRIHEAQILETMKAQGFSPAHMNHKAVQLAATVPTIDAAALNETYGRVVRMYNTLSYGEVMYTGAHGTLEKNLFADLVKVKGDEVPDDLTELERLARIPAKSALMPPTLNHNTLELLRATGDPSQYFVPSGSFESAADHTKNSCHVAPVSRLACVDIALVADKADPEALGKLLIAAKDNPAVNFVQLEVGEHGSVKAMQSALTAEWKGRVDGATLEYMHARVVQNGSGIHLHVKFLQPEFGKPLSMLEYPHATR